MHDVFIDLGDVSPAITCNVFYSAWRAAYILISRADIHRGHLRALNETLTGSWALRCRLRDGRQVDMGYGHTSPAERTVQSPPRTPKAAILEQEKAISEVWHCYPGAADLQRPGLLGVLGKGCTC